jgi:hypothetical protein
MNHLYPKLKRHVSEDIFFVIAKDYCINDCSPRSLNIVLWTPERLLDSLLIENPSIKVERRRPVSSLKCDIKKSTDKTQKLLDKMKAEAKVIYALHLFFILISIYSVGSSINDIILTRYNRRYFVNEDILQTI